MRYELLPVPCWRAQGFTSRDEAAAYFARRVLDGWMEGNDFAMDALALGDHRSAMYCFLDTIIEEPTECVM